MNRINLSIILATAALTQLGFDQLGLAKEQPNVVLIFADDVGLGDVHCTGGPFNTPNIDALAAGGMRFSHCYAAPLCDPSRCMLLTGRYPFRTGFTNNHVDYNLPAAAEIMIPTVLKQSGYVSSCVGKWSRLSGSAGSFGFDDYMSFRSSGPPPWTASRSVAARAPCWKAAAGCH